MTSALRVDPAILRAEAAKTSQLAADVKATGSSAGASLSSAANGVAGLQCAGACDAAAESVVAASGGSGDRWSSFGDNLGKAAQAYERADAEHGAKVDKAGETPEHGFQPVPGGPVGARPININDVTYDKVGSPGGPQATQGYINQALDRMGITDPAARQRWSQAYLTLTEHESSQRPNAINDYDSNARKSTANVSDGYGNWCSRGLAQCVPPTFAQYHQPGTSNNIYDPVANIAASMNYVMARYDVNRDASNIFAQVAPTNPGTRQGY